MWVVGGTFGPAAAGLPIVESVPVMPRQTVRAALSFLRAAHGHACNGDRDQASAMIGAAIDTLEGRPASIEPQSEAAALEGVMAQAFELGHWSRLVGARRTAPFSDSGMAGAWDAGWAAASREIIRAESGEGRDLREEAVTNVDRRRGYTVEHASDPDWHRHEYDVEEERLRAETCPRCSGTRAITVPDGCVSAAIVPCPACTPRSLSHGDRWWPVGTRLRARQGQGLPWVDVERENVSRYLAAGFEVQHWDGMFWCNVEGGDGGR